MPTPSWSTSYIWKRSFTLSFTCPTFHIGYHGKFYEKRNLHNWYRSQSTLRDLYLIFIRRTLHALFFSFLKKFYFELDLFVLSYATVIEILWKKSLHIIGIVLNPKLDSLGLISIGKTLRAHLFISSSYISRSQNQREKKKESFLYNKSHVCVYIYMYIATSYVMGP